MNAFSSERSRNFSDPSCIYNFNAKEFFDCPYVGMEPELLSDIFDAEFENFSELSIDSTSDSSWKYKIQGNPSCFQPLQNGESNFMYGSSDRETLSPFELPGETLSPFELPELSRSLGYSDDDMSEILSLDRTVIPNNSPFDNIEELRYFQEFVHNAQYCNEYDSREAQDLSEYDPNLVKDLYWNRGVARGATSEYDSSERLLYDRLSLEERLRSIVLNDEQARFYGKLPSSDTPKQFVTGGNWRTTKVPEAQLNEGKRYGKKAANGVVKPLLSSSCTVLNKKNPSSSTVLNKKNQAKPCSAASDGEQRIFLGGLPIGMTERSLRQQLAAKGYKVLKRPKILRGFAPEVLMRSAQEAKELVELGTIIINGVEVEVRPFNSLMKQSESRKIPNVKKRSIFLRGLSEGTTAKDIQEVFAKQGIRIVNYPAVKFGFARQVILETVRQARALIEKKKILIKGTLVDVKPFVRQQSKKKNH